MKQPDRTKRTCLLAILIPGSFLVAGGCDAELVNRLALEATAEAAGSFLTGLIDAGVADVLEE